LLVPSVINKYYLVDLSPGRSMVADALGRGRQCFVVSFVNPDVSHAGLGLNDYTSALLEVLAAVEAISGSPRTHVAAFCAGTVVVAALAGYLAAVGNPDRLASLTLALSVLDPERGGVMNALLDRRTADAAISKAARTGYADGRATASMFSWIRPNEGIWLPAINNYLLGNDPRPLTCCSGQTTPPTSPPRCNGHARDHPRQWVCPARQGASARAADRPQPTSGSTPTCSRA
jgi:poly(3-hydroxyalkanoate) synthetase